MSIDASDFVAQGKPTVKQVETVWNSMPSPSARIVAAELTKRGFSISWRTVARYAERNWSEKVNGRHAQTAPPIAARQKVPKAVEKEVKKEVAKLSETAQRVAMEGLEAAVGKPINEIEVDLIEKRREELAMKSEAELDVIEGKARKIYNILLLEEAARRVEVMVLIPKDTAALVTSMTEAAGAQLSGGENQPPKADDPNVIDLTPNKPVDPEPINDTVSAIRRFQAAQGRRA